MWWLFRRSQWPWGLRRGSTAAGLLELWVRIPPGAWMTVCCECCVLSGRGLCDGLVTRPEESYRLWCVVVCDLETSRMRRPWPAFGRSATGGGGEAFHLISTLRYNDISYHSGYVCCCAIVNRLEHNLLMRISGLKNDRDYDPYGKSLVLLEWHCAVSFKYTWFLDVKHARKWRCPGDLMSGFPMPRFTEVTHRRARWDVVWLLVLVEPDCSAKGVGCFLLYSIVGRVRWQFLQKARAV